MISLLCWKLISVVLIICLVDIMMVGFRCFIGRLLMV